MTVAASSCSPLVINDWSIYAHPLFLDNLEEMIEEVEERKKRDPENYKRKNSAKRLAAILKLITEVIPADPANPAFRQGKTLGDGKSGWFRAKFLQQYRLFFRFDSTSKVIVLAWVNDETTLRAYGSRTDAYDVFRRMLEAGHPPADFEALMNEARSTAGRLSDGVAAAQKA